MMTLRQAGYRERVYAKLRLAELGRVDAFNYELDHARYAPHYDRVTLSDGFRFETRFEGSQSREGLARFGLDDSGCDSTQKGR